MDYLEAWEKRYREEGRLWNGVPFPVPSLGPGSRVLDLGCGNGKNLVPLLEAGHKVVGLDISATAIDICRAELERRALDGELLVGDARSLPFEDGSFDAVVAVHCLGHMLEVDRGKAIAEARRVLKGGGRLHARLFSMGDMRHGRGEQVEPGTFRRGNGILVHYFDEGELEQALANAGFASVSVSLENRRARLGEREGKREELVANCRR